MWLPLQFWMERASLCKQPVQPSSMVWKIWLLNLCGHFTLLSDCLYFLWCKSSLWPKWAYQTITNVRISISWALNKYCKVARQCSAPEGPGYFLSGSLYKVAETPVKEPRNEQHSSSLVIWILSWEEKCWYNSPASCVTTWSKAKEEAGLYLPAFFFRRTFLLQLRNLTETSSNHHWYLPTSFLYEWLKEENGISK